MAWPDTAVRDTFNRADENPIAGNWTPHNLRVTGGGDLQIVSNAVKNAINAIGSAAWSAATEGVGDVEVYATVPIRGSTSNWHLVHAKLTTLVPATADGYECAFRDNSTVIRVRRIDNDVLTQLGADIVNPVSLQSGDKVGMKCLNDASGTIEVWFYDASAGGPWTLVATRTDATYKGVDGYIGIGLEGGTTITFDDFGGGLVGGAGPSVTLLQMQNYMRHGI